MKNNAFKIIRSLPFFFIGFVFPPLALAQQDLDPCAGGNSELAMCTTNDLGFGGALGTIIQFLFVIGVILALGFLVFGGIKWITSGGDKGGVEAARNTIIAAIIGLIVMFLAYVVINLILIFLTGEGIGGVKIPTLGDGSANSSNNDDTCGRSGQPVCAGRNPFCDTGFKPDDPINLTACVPA